MSVCLITGAGGLVGSQSVIHFRDNFEKIVGIENDFRKYFFGQEASTLANLHHLSNTYVNFENYPGDIRDLNNLELVFSKYSQDISLIIHTAAQPSHDWAAKEPLTDFTINATGTMHLLELTRKHCPEAVFIFTSTNKVYGDRPNYLPLKEFNLRLDIDKNHPYYQGIDESMSIDQSLHSLFGVSKAAADLMVQEYGRYFGLKTGVFRGGCITGPNHAGTELHGFLAYLMKCCFYKRPYTVFGYKGKQVRDNIHSKDLVSVFEYFYRNPRIGEVYNVGGGRLSNCSILEAIKICESITGNLMDIRYSEVNRIGDHKWYISNMEKFQSHYSQWEQKFDLHSILAEMYKVLCAPAKI